MIHRHDQKVLQAYSQMLLTRGVEGFITTDTSIKDKPARPTVAVAGHERVKGVTNIILDERLGARLALTHLAELGHEEIAFMKGAPFSSDSTARWQAIVEIAEDWEFAFGLSSPYKSTAATLLRILATRCQGIARPDNRRFTAVFAYNDISAIWRHVGLPRNRFARSLIRFRGWLRRYSSGSISDPGLTTIRQPLARMGEIAAKTVIEQIEGHADYLAEIVVEPEVGTTGFYRPCSGGAAMQSWK